MEPWLFSHKYVALVKAFCSDIISFYQTIEVNVLFFSVFTFIILIDIVIDEQYMGIWPLFLFLEAKLVSWLSNCTVINNCILYGFSTYYLFVTILSNTHKTQGILVQ